MKGKILGLAAAFLALSAGDAHAYLDPGTGSIVLQAIIAGVASAALALKLSWRRLTSVFSGKRRAERPPDGGPSGEPPR